eukprot:TRINITY_DN63230_c0_g1_i1.p1 TRINITY_DN63230_c0_g1~~TRINITY_DN63230_c0_g1_i1.p1  ORF type:complete len:588 (-),score=88.57 TRINITY_DN63230_c0_g1_i1:91-1854(-)
MSLEDEKKSSPPLAERISPYVSGPIMVLLIYALLYSCLGHEMMAPYRKGFALYVCWISGLFGGFILGFIKQPPLLGMLLAGIVLRNVGSPSLVDSLPEEWGAAVRCFGLSVILMRSGLELDLGAIKRIGPACVRLTVLPGCSEALTVGLAGYVIFGMPIALSLSLGFILAAVSPAVVVGGMFDLQRRGYGLIKGIPSLVVAAASFDDVVAITGYSLCFGFAIPHEDANLLWEAMHGPINVGVGFILGSAGGVLVSNSLLWDTAPKRTVAAALVGLALAFACTSVGFTGAGALASLVSTCVAARNWGRLAAAHAAADQARICNGDDDSTSSVHDDPAHWAHDVETHLAFVWSKLAQPLLFCVIGCALSFKELDSRTIPASCLVVLCGVLVRCPVAALSLCNTDLVKKERIFVGLAWIPKATVQAALGGIPLDAVRTTMHRDHDPEKFDLYEKWGLQILTTAVFSILITAPIGLLVIQNLGHVWLSYDGTTNQGKSEVKDRKTSMAMRTNVITEGEHVTVTLSDVAGKSDDCNGNGLSHNDIDIDSLSEHSDQGFSNNATARRSAKAPQKIGNPSMLCGSGCFGAALRP